MDEVTAESWLKQGDEFFNQKKYDEALDCYLNATDINPDLAPAWHNMGLICQLLGQQQEADICFTKEREAIQKANVERIRKIKSENKEEITQGKPRISSFKKSAIFGSIIIALIIWGVIFIPTFFPPSIPEPQITIKPTIIATTAVTKVATTVTTQVPIKAVVATTPKPLPTPMNRYKIEVSYPGPVKVKYGDSRNQYIYDSNAGGSTFIVENPVGYVEATCYPHSHEGAPVYPKTAFKVTISHDNVILASDQQDCLSANMIPCKKTFHAIVYV
jgi:tetratricopeptide (TPR) repeat protein